VGAIRTNYKIPRQIEKLEGVGTQGRMLWMLEAENQGSPRQGTVLFAMVQQKCASAAPRLWYLEPIQTGKLKKWWEPRKKSMLAKGQSKEESVKSTLRDQNCPDVFSDVWSVLQCLQRFLRIPSAW
jgi:hypothetical protein